MKVTISHPTGNANVRSAINGLVSANLLDRFHTSIASFNEDFLGRVGNINWGPFTEIKRRQFNDWLQPYTVSHPWREVGRLIALRAGINSLIRHETGTFCIDNIYRSIDKHTADALKRAQQNGSSAVYAYEDAALYSFRKAKELGMQCLYDLPIGYWRTARTLLEAERDKWPQWSQTLTGFSDSEEKLARKDEELLLADKIYVASSFTAKTLQDFPGKLAPVEVIPYGFPTVGENRVYDLTPNRPIKLLFVGGLSQRKGIANLFEAVKKFGDKVILTVVGGKNGEPCPALDKALTKHKWIPGLPHHEILKLMRENDVLVFPSLFEGFGLVITEAMSQGTPVITTNRTAGNEFIKHGTNGWLVSPGSTSAIEEVIEDILLNPRQLQIAGKQAMLTALLRPWEIYSKELTENIKSRF